MIKLYFFHILHKGLCGVQYLFKTSNLVSYVSNTNFLFDMHAKNCGCNRKDDDVSKMFNKTHPHNNYVKMSLKNVPCMCINVRKHEIFYQQTNL